MQRISLFVTKMETKKWQCKIKHLVEIKTTMSHTMLDERKKNVSNNQWILILVHGDKLSRVKIV